MRCEHVFRTARRIVGGRFYDYLVCDLCGKMQLPGSIVVSVTGVDKEASDKVQRLLQEGHELLAKTHGKTTHYTLIDPAMLGSPIGG